ncbi:FHA domain-containing protein [Nocardia suismassiliense]|uniref:FHA domain-containing protein n=1 Tax=Nocardia suismassiliense TaxID=2077092 RepID=UPI000D1E0C73|nr:FHA domain-containing protein [Nocardia suismassiliense]
MVASCPDGHQSVATDYCDVCGAPMCAAAPTAAVEPVALCPSCGAPSAGRFCEVCGHDSALPSSAATPDPVIESEPTQTESVVPNVASVAPDPAPAGSAVTWVATVSADREFYDRVIARKGPDADQVGFPPFYPERRIILRGNDISVGKRSVSQGLTPDIDLGIAPADVGVSRTHAVIHIDGDALTVTDLGSTNGTSVNGSDDLIPAKVPVRLRSGDRIHLGGWTTIVFTREQV